ncbi:MAG: PH domain-containing protein [Planctomycetaceae bacterium]
MSVQAIAGVSPTSEARIMTEFPSVAASGVGCLIGQLMDSIPISIFGVKLSYLLFGLPLAPLGALLFLLNRPFGARYILTNRSVQVWASLGTQRTAVVDLNDIVDVELDQRPGQAFFRSSDICLKAANGQTIVRLAGVCDPGPFRNAIQRAMQSRRLVQSSLATIAARK